MLRAFQQRAAQVATGLTRRQLGSLRQGSQLAVAAGRALNVPCRGICNSAAIPNVAAKFSAASAAAPPATAPAPSSSSRTPIDWPVGHEHAGFRVVRRTPVAEFNLVVYELHHGDSGALAYHISRADEDNAFCVAFRTPVEDSTGVAHILEHTVLCGSQRYPVRDPFFLLVRRSLKTFMNAMTAQDYTMYPFSTCNQKDYNNLLEVYLDAVFFPLLKETDFRQEGHRLELVPQKNNNTFEEKAQFSAAEEVVEASSAPQQSVPASASQPQHSARAGDAQGLDLQIKGVVYNEMKGAMSDTSQLFLQRLQSALFPANSNRWNSGGEPLDIPSLTHSQLRAFHQKHYALDNAVFLSYGDMPPPLELIVERVIEPTLAERRKQGKIVTSVPPRQAAYQPQPRFDSPRTVRTTCPPDPLVPDPSKQTKVAISFMCPPMEGTDPANPGKLTPEAEVELFALNMLSALILDGPTAPMYRALIDPNIGSGYAPGTGFDSASTEGTFTFGLQGVSSADVDKVLDLVEETLYKCAQEGFPAERVEAILHQIEVGLRHVRSNFGVGLIMKLIPLWAQGSDPLAPLRVQEHIDRMRQKLQEGPYFQRLIEKHLLNNPHSVTLIMEPDSDYAKKESETEERRLREQSNTLSRTDKQRIDEQAKELLRLQNTKPDTEACKLPSLSAADISRTSEHIELQQLDVKGGQAIVVGSAESPPSKSAKRASPAVSSQATLPKLVSLEQPTNGVGYVRAVVNAKVVPLELRPLLPLYCAFLTEMGAGNMDYRALAHQLDMHTGGLSAEVQAFAQLDSLEKHEEVVLIKALALQRNIPKAFDLLATVLREPVFTDPERLQQLLLQTAAATASSMQDSGSSYATSDASSHLFPAAAASELYGGMKHATFLNNLVSALTLSSPEEARAILTDVGEKLTQISRILLREGIQRAFVVGDESSLKILHNQLPTLLEASRAEARGLAATPAVELPFQRATGSVKNFFALPLQVNNVALVLPTVPYTHPDAPKLDVLARILAGVYVHREVREKGGAYGGGASHSAEGLLSFSSYRDPNTVATISAYRSAPQWLTSPNSFTSEDVEEALLSIFSHIDAPKPPSAKGLGQFLYGVTQEQRQKYRDQLLAVDKNAVLDVCSRYLSPAALDAAHVSIVGDESGVPAEISKSSNWQVQALQLAGAVGAESGGLGDDPFADEEDEGEEDPALWEDDEEEEQVRPRRK